MEPKNVWETYSAKQLKELEVFNKDYRDFLDNGKTERECVNAIVNLAEKSGYVELEKKLKGSGKLRPGQIGVCLKDDVDAAVDV